MKTRRKQVGGEHYAKKAIQPWDAMKVWMKPEEFIGFLWGNAIKYLARWQEKGGLEDLKKAQHYTDELIIFVKQQERKKNGKRRANSRGRNRQARSS